MSTFGTARLENGPDPVRGRAQLFASGGEQVAVHASLDTLMMLGRCQMALFQCASSFVTGPARRHEQLPIAHPTFASSRAWLADSCGMQKHAGFILNSVAKQLHGTRMATTRIHFGLCANVKVPSAVSRRELSIGLTSGPHKPNPEYPALLSSSRSGRVLGEGGVKIVIMSICCIIES